MSDAVSWKGRNQAGYSAYFHGGAFRKEQCYRVLYLANSFCDVVEEHDRERPVEALSVAVFWIRGSRSYVKAMAVGMKDRHFIEEWHRRDLETDEIQVSDKEEVRLSSWT